MMMIQSVLKTMQPGVRQAQPAGITPPLPQAKADQFSRTSAKQPVLSSSLRFSSDPNIDKIFSPKSIALIGASNAPGTIGKVVLENLLQNQYKGQIFLINPKYAGQNIPWAGNTVSPFLKDAASLPANTVDMAVITTPAKTVPGIIRELGAKGVKGVVVISAGFSETGASGQALGDELKQALKDTGIRMIGPNCVGVANGSPAVNLNATFVSGTITPGKGAIMSQSGAVSIDLINQARLAGLGFAQMASIGNQTDIDSAQLLKQWAADPSVKYVLGYLESVENPVAFREVATEVSKTKPVILIKSGKSASGAKAASSHTGALAGSDTAVSALFRQSGVQRVDSIQDLFSVAKAFELAPPLAGNRVAIFSNSGGYGVMLTDDIETSKPELQVAQLSDATHATLKSLLPPAASTKNPVDTTASVPSDSPENFKKSLEAIAADPNADAVVVSVVPLLNIKPDDVGRILSEVQANTTKPVIGVLSTSEQTLLDVQNTLTRENRPVPALYRTLEDALTGLSAMEKHRQWAQKPIGQVKRFADVKKDIVKNILDAAKAENRKLLTTDESLNILSAYGITTPQFAMAQTEDEAKQAAQKIGFPVAIKIVSKTHTHKTDIGGVIIDIRTPEQLATSLTQLTENLKKAGITQFHPGEGIMVQQFITSGRETLIGFKNDDKFGKMIGFGPGGIYVNTLKDVQFRIAPLAPEEARDMIQSIKMIDILKGVRGKKSVDFEALEEVILRYSQLTQDFPELSESDINPYFAQPKPANGGQGGIAVDARFTLS